MATTGIQQQCPMREFGLSSKRFSTIRYAGSRILYSKTHAVLKPNLSEGQYGKVCGASLGLSLYTIYQQHMTIKTTVQHWA
jgi:hypothetical protein